MSPRMAEPVLPGKLSDMETLGNTPDRLTQFQDWDRGAG